MKQKINVCVACKKIYNESKNEHCKNGKCKRNEQAVLEINSALFWNRISAALSTGIRGDIYGTVRRATRQYAAPKVTSEEPKPKQLTGDISE